ncbi:hypothetical protein [Streptomyces sp. NPDC056013]|uniref:hypothetical protein n=1 Tax=Streptomyces sp. NPDC056013 TaxID=3345680 RepID=UPI0035D92A6F
MGALTATYTGASLRRLTAPATPPLAVPGGVRVTDRFRSGSGGLRITLAWPAGLRGTAARRASGGLVRHAVPYSAPGQACRCRRHACGGLSPDAYCAEHLAVVGGVEHWPRAAVLALRRAQASHPAAGGRPRRAGDQVPRDQVLDLTAQLLDADPAISAAYVTEELGVHCDTAQRALAAVRAERIADHLTTHRGLTPDQAAAQLGYPAGQVRTATRQALTVLRARAAAPYLAAITDALRTAGLTAATAPAVQHDGDTVRAAVLLTADAPAAALVWNEETGWHTADSRRRPVARTPLLSGHTHPDLAALLHALTT